MLDCKVQLVVIASEVPSTSSKDPGFLTWVFSANNQYDGLTNMENFFLGGGRVPWQIDTLPGPAGISRGIISRADLCDWKAAIPSGCR
jgi:hypothetical protein